MYLPTCGIIKRLGIASVEIDKNCFTLVERLCHRWSRVQLQSGCFFQRQRHSRPHSPIRFTQPAGSDTRNEGHFVSCAKAARREANRAMGTREMAIKGGSRERLGTRFLLRESRGLTFLLLFRPYMHNALTSLLLTMICYYKKSCACRSRLI